MNALLIVDPNMDFFPGGALGVGGGDKIIDPLNRIIACANKEGWLILVSRDWHPAGADHFKKWPVHCVQDTPGAMLHPKLNLVGAIVISKGTEPDEDGYSPFEGHDANGNPLETILRGRGITDIYFGGLATDYCVKAAGIDGAKLGFKMHLLSDASRAVNIHQDDGDAAIAEMVAIGVEVTMTSEVIEGRAA